MAFLLERSQESRDNSIVFPLPLLITKCSIEAVCLLGRRREKGVKPIRLPCYVSTMKGPPCPLSFTQSAWRTAGPCRVPSRWSKPGFTVYIGQVSSLASLQLLANCLGEPSQLAGSGLALRAENLYLNQNPLLQIEATAYLLRIIHCHLSTGKVIHMEAMRVQALGNGSLMTWERSIFNLCF